MSSIAKSLRRKEYEKDTFFYYFTGTGHCMFGDVGVVNVESWYDSDWKINQARAN